MCHFQVPVTGMLFLILLLLHTYGSKDYQLQVGGNSGYIASPNHPEKYPKNIACVWNISVDSGFAINLTLWNFDVERTANCSADFLQIRISLDQKWQDLKRYCSNAPPSVFSKNGLAQVRFVSDSKSEFTGFNITWSAVGRIAETSIISSKDLMPSPTASQQCNGLPMLYDTVTISSCIKAQTSYLPQRPVVRSLLNNSDCICETSISRSSPSLPNATQSMNAELQTSVESSSYNALASSFATKPPNFTRSLVENPLITEMLKSSSHHFLSIEHKSLRSDILQSPSSQFSPSMNKPLKTNGVESSSSTSLSLKDMPWTTDILHSSSSQFSSSMNKPLKTNGVNSSSSTSLSLKDMPWTTDILHSSSSQFSSSMNKPLKTNGVNSSSSTSLSLKGMPWTTDILHSSSSQFSSLVNNSLKTNGIKSSSSTSLSSKDMPWTTDVLKSSNSFASEVMGIDSKTSDSAILSSIQTARMFDVSTDILSMSPVPVDCRRKAKVNDLPSTLVNILWAVGGTFAFTALMLGILLYKEIKSNRVDVRFVGSQTTP